VQTSFCLKKPRSIASNLETLSDSKVIHFYNQRGEDSENRIKELKNDFGARQLPCGDFNANALYFDICSWYVTELLCTTKSKTLPLLPIKWRILKVACPSMALPFLSTKGCHWLSLSKKILSQHEGGQSLDDTTHIAKDKALRLITNKSVPTPQAIGIWLRRLGEDNQGIKALQKVNKTVLKATLNHCKRDVVVFCVFTQWVKRFFG
jgi:hypothetical protein